MFRTLQSRRSSAPGWFKQRRPLCGVFLTRGKNRGGTKQLYGIRPTCVPTRRRPCLFFPSRGIRRRSVPETSPCHVQAKQDGKLDPRRVTRHSPGAFAAESRPQQTRHRHPATHRLSSKPARHVGSLGWLFSMQNPRSPARRPIQAYEVEPSAHRSPQGIVVPDQDSLCCARSLTPQFGT